MPGTDDRPAVGRAFPAHLEALRTAVALIQHQRFVQAVGTGGQVDIDILLVARLERGNDGAHSLPGLVQCGQGRINRARVLIVAVGGYVKSDTHVVFLQI